MMLKYKQNFKMMSILFGTSSFTTTKVHELGAIIAHFTALHT